MLSNVQKKGNHDINRNIRTYDRDDVPITNTRDHQMAKKWRRERNAKCRLTNCQRHLGTYKDRKMAKGVPLNEIGFPEKPTGGILVSDLVAANHAADKKNHINSIVVKEPVTYGPRNKISSSSKPILPWMDKTERPFHMTPLLSEEKKKKQEENQLLKKTRRARNLLRKQRREAIAKQKLEEGKTM